MSNFVDLHFVLILFYNELHMLDKVRKIPYKIKGATLFLLRCLCSLFFTICIFLLPYVNSRRNIWHTFWFVVGSIYLYTHWSKAMTFIPFNGHSLIFIVWLVMIFRPFVKTVNCKLGGIEFTNDKLSDSKQNYEKILKEKRAQVSQRT